MIDAAVDEIWHVQVTAGDVRIVTLDKLDDLYRYDVIDEHAFVWQTGMTEWVPLGTLLGIESHEPEEPFHVVLSSGGVRELSLEQLDDFYRNEIIDERTLVWQKGMTEWQPLGKVAGIDSAATPEPPTVPHRQIAAQPFVASAPTSPPVAFTIEPPPAVAAQSSGRWPVRLALVAGMILAVFRNDLAYSVVGQTPLASRYTDAEARVFGGPVFGTTRSVERLVAECGGHLEPVRLPVAVTQYADAQKSSAARAKVENATESTSGRPSSAVSKPTANASAATSVATPAMVAPATANATALPTTVADVPNAKGKNSTALSQNVATALGALPVKASAPPSKSTARPAKKRASSSKGAMRAGGSYFDPLNPSL
jgi:hypothetical protein